MRRTAGRVNRAYTRSGTLWEGRYRSCLVQHALHLLSCRSYIELNPLRAGMVDHPGAYRWSSYRCNAQGEADELIRPHAVFTALDADPRICGEHHRGLFLNALEPGDVGRKRAGTNDSAALRDDRSAARLRSVPRNWGLSPISPFHSKGW